MGIGENLAVIFADLATFDGGGIIVNLKEFNKSLPEVEGLLDRAGNTTEQVRRENKTVDD